jgi:hypothetical protein
MSIETQTQDLIDAANDLNSSAVGLQTVITTQVNASRDAAANSAAAAVIAKNESVTAKNQAVIAQNNAIAVVTGGTATITPSAGKIPLADSFGKINTGWISDGQLLELSDLGTGPNEIPLNQYLGELAYMNAESVVIQPQASVTPNALGDMVFQLSSNTSLVIKVKGLDGVIRSVTLTLA